jgi:hypothetical protein
MEMSDIMKSQLLVDPSLGFGFSNINLKKAATTKN